MDLNSRREIAENLLSLRQSGDLAGAIELCSKASKKFPDDYFYPKIAGDLYFKLKGYEIAFQFYLEFLEKLRPGKKVFAQFAKRYYQLKRVLPYSQFSMFVSKIRDDISSGKVDEKTASRCIDLIGPDIIKTISPSHDAQKLIEYLTDDHNFSRFVNNAKKLETKDPLQLELVMNNYMVHPEFAYF